MKEVALAEIQSDLSWYLELAETEEIIIINNGKPIGILIGLQSDDDLFDYRLENDSRFLKRIQKSRQSLREGKGVKLDDLDI
ncbi:type II toxin-antitoxin system Phd/YefM family antitoxin [Iningainema tapete]|uniref:Type II toxin-antitoxin system Phd/YefM family antitoxin n=1 Tax=Iningainema tapete BLCC-T55 TaxID=2748662 RepID=A0A8J6XDX0_9CYAN|nr:type II toxin-antitoxin system Phd/YefM family antitoxin [Iningainema tapete]MBD2774425.1 type II toxin-antitoxin system Phd/YefM family antitoxin [Iningainema tapete BLCC-T55]